MHSAEPPPFLPWKASSSLQTPVRACGHVFSFLVPFCPIASLPDSVQDSLPTVLPTPPARLASVRLPCVHAARHSGVRAVVSQVTSGLASWETCPKPWHHCSLCLFRGEPHPNGGPLVSCRKGPRCGPRSRAVHLLLSLSLLSSTSDRCTCQASSALA